MQKLNRQILKFISLVNFLIGTAILLYRPSIDVVRYYRLCILAMLCMVRMEFDCYCLRLHLPSLLHDKITGARST